MADTAVSEGRPSCRTCWLLTLDEATAQREGSRPLTGSVYLCPKHQESWNRMTAGVNWDAFIDFGRFALPRPLPVVSEAGQQETHLTDQMGFELLGRQDHDSAAEVVAEAEPPSWLAGVIELAADSYGWCDDEGRTMTRADELHDAGIVILAALPAIEAGLREQIAGEIRTLRIPVYGDRGKVYTMDEMRAYGEGITAADRLVRGRSGI